MKTGRRTLVLSHRRTLRVIAATLAIAVSAGLLSAPAALAEPPNSQRPKVSDQERAVKGKNLKVRPRKAESSGPGPAAKASWPEAGIGQATVPAQGGARGNATAVRAGKLPVYVLPADTRAPKGGTRLTAKAPAAEKVAVTVLDAKTTQNAGLNGLAFTVARTDAAAPGRVNVRLDYSTFAQAFGGAYGARLRLLQLPACALTTPAKAECRTGTPVTATNNTADKTLTTQIDAEPAPSGSATGGTVLLAAAGSSGSQGDYKATALEASATWQAGGNGGDFTWSYPMRVPPVPSGLTPKVEVSYSSGSVDGKTANTNGQPSWVGQGFDLNPGFIERRFKSCEDDGAPKDEWGNSPGDRCWGYDNATVTWNGKGGELIKAADGTWRTKSDDGTKFEKLASTATGNGDDGDTGDKGEYWKVTTTDGTQYYFGYNRVPGWVSGKPETDSTWTTPVFGNDSGEQCHKSTGFKDSSCQQAYRWNLDYVVDPGGNAIVYTYGKETNHYGRNLKAEDEIAYTRGGYLKTISYGLRKDGLFGKAPAQVSFTASERCLPDETFDCDPAKIGDNPDKWWDVPWDLNCNSGQECKDTHGTLSPTFWSRMRLTKVTTQILKPDASGYRPVDSWAMNHSWGLADVERDLRLDEIRHTGHAADGTTSTLPKVSFDHVQLPNRLDKTGDDILPYIRYRLGAIKDESGGQLDINYADPDCTLSDLPTPHTNTTRCMPVIWQPPGYEDPITDWFHKYVVNSVTQVDRTGLSPDMSTRYEYVGGAAWHYDDDDGLTKEKNKTWSQWRGYGQVRTFTGNYSAPATQSETHYMRGMDGDRLNKDGGTKTVTVPDGEGGTHTDHDALAGFTLRTVTYDKPGGVVHTKTVNTPWRVQTASRTRPWGTTTANVIAVDTTQTWTAKDGGGWTQTKTDNTYQPSGAGVGRITLANDLGDVSTSSDDKCTRTGYADNSDAWMVTFPSRVETVSVACTVTPDRSKQLVSDVRTFYDGGIFDQAPSAGHVTKADKIASHDGSTASYTTQAQTRYDSHGRPTHVTDAAGQVSTTTYTDTQGLNTQVSATSPPAKAGDDSTTLVNRVDIDPARGQPVTKVDVSNGLTSDLEYDPLGRLTKVWLPDRSKATGQTPSFEYEYRVAEGQIVAVTTKTLNSGGGGQRDSIELLDGWLRPRQAQVTGQLGRLITDTFYDDRGQTVKTYAPYSATGAPQTELFGVDFPGDVETQSRTEYDGLGRKTLERQMRGNGSQPEAELRRTTYSYGGGNRVSVTPPEPGTPTMKLTDARGQVTERRQYKGPAPTGDTFDATTYTYTPSDQVASVTDPSGNTWNHTYDLRGREIESTDPDSGTTKTGYDDLDRPVSVTDARGKKIFTGYDGLSRAIERREGSATGTLLASWTYDTVTRGKGKPATSVRHTPTGDYTSFVRAYDRVGHVTNMAVTVPDSEGPLAGTYGFGTSYNADGTVQGHGLPAVGGLSGEGLAYTYDAFQRPTTLTSNLATYIGATDYTPTGKPKMLEFGTASKRAWNTMTWEYGTQRLETSRTYREGIGGSSRHATYKYDKTDNITSIADVSTDGTDNQCFKYDHLQRLTQAWTQGTTADCGAEPTDAVIGGPAPYWEDFTYDKAGNRTQETRHGIAGAGDIVRNYTYATPGNGNRLAKVVQTGAAGDRTDTYTYDTTGNTTGRTQGSGPGTTPEAFDWNTEGQLTKVTQNGNDTTHVYDADGGRLIRKDPSGTTLYLPGGTELRADNGATTATATRYFTYAGQTVAMRTSQGVTHLTGDHQSTAQIAINAADLQTTVRRTTPFGAIRGMDEDATWPGEKGFVGGTKDPTGLTHLGAREYDPDTGRFISVDPILDQADPQQMNGYSYANDNPVTNSDPDGKLCHRIGGSVECFNGDGGDRRGNNKGGYDVYDSNGRKYPNRGGFSNGMGNNSPRRSIAGRGPSGCTGAEMYMRSCGQRQRMLEKVVITRHAPPPPVHWTDVMGAVGWFAKQALGVDDIKACAAGDAEACAWVAAGFVPGGKFARPAAKAGKAAGVGRKAAKGCSSFVPGTSVLMADGTAKPIQDIKVGDTVQATDPETGRTEAKPVLATITSKGDKNLVQITINTNGPRPHWTTGNEPQNTGATLRDPDGSDNGVIIATDTHPFWVAGGLNTWIKATDLKPGMWLRTSAGTYVQITAAKHWTTHHQRVHNLTIADQHTYYVLAERTTILVHNSGTCSLYEGEGWEHVLKDHVPGSPGVDPEATLFSKYLDPDDIGDLIEETVQGKGKLNTPDPITGEPRTGIIYEKDFGYPIGHKQGSKGGAVSRVRVILNTNGSIRTAFPF